MNRSITLIATALFALSAAPALASEITGTLSTGATTPPAGTSSLSGTVAPSSGGTLSGTVVSPNTNTSGSSGSSGSGGGGGGGSSSGGSSGPGSVLGSSTNVPGLPNTGA
ncbi:MAG TPA: hypothetical protein VJK53_00670, partial [Candidatus Paceibacterota bacterium]